MDRRMDQDGVGIRLLILFAEASPRCDEPLSTTQNTRSAAAYSGRSMTCSTRRPNGSIPVLASQRPMTRPCWTSQAARYCNAPPRSYSASTRRQPTRGRPEGRVTANAGLDARFLVGADDPVERVEPLPLPVALVQVQDDGGLLEEVGGAREDPVFVLPGLDGVLVEDSPDRAAADRLVQFARARLARSVVDWRLNGLPVRATTSQAIEATTALSRGGKDRLAATAGIVLEGEPPVAQRCRQRRMELGCRSRRAAAAPLESAGDSWRSKTRWWRCRRCDAAVRGREEASGLGEELVRESSGDEAAEGQARDDSSTDWPRDFSDDHSQHSGRLRESVTLPLIVKWPT